MGSAKIRRIGFHSSLGTAAYGNPMYAYICSVESPYLYPFVQYKKAYPLLGILIAFIALDF